jgi:hypothetical protein
VRASDDMIVDRALHEAEVIAVGSFHVYGIRVFVNNVFYWNIEPDRPLWSEARAKKEILSDNNKASMLVNSRALQVLLR